MLHNEARKLLIQALERSHNVREVARNYCVNRSTVYRLKKRLDETSSIETRTYLRGRKPALTPEEVHKSARVCHLHGENLPQHRRLSATSPAPLPPKSSAGNPTDRARRY